MARVRSIAGVLKRQELADGQSATGVFPRAAELAKAYIEYLYSAEGQTLAAKNHYRPSDPSLVTDQALVEAFPKIDLISIDDPLFGGWKTAQPKHFGDGGIFDQVYTPAQ